MAAVCFAVHDVAPATWPQCKRLLDMLDDLGATPATLLVVPDYHRRGQVAADSAFLRAMDARLARGDELALHGWCHLDEAPPPRGLRDRLRRRMLTAGEGEFAALGYEEAFHRIAHGVALWRRRCWPLYGFVPPAWLIGSEARRALAAFPFAYTTTRTRVARCDGTAAVDTTTLAYSTRSPLRRGASHAAVELARLASGRALLRITLHPADAEHPGVLAHWRRVIAKAVARRTPMTKAEWVRHVMEPSLPQARTAGFRPA